MHERYFIERIHLGGNPPSQLDLAVPDRAGISAINVIAGANNSGKSRLLDQIRRALKRRARQQDFAVEPDPPLNPNVLFLGRLWWSKEDAGVIHADFKGAQLDLPADRGDYRRLGLQFLVDQFAARLGAELVSSAEALADPYVSRRIVEMFPGVETTMVRCRATKVVADLERILLGSLYLRVAKRRKGTTLGQFELVLLYGDGKTVPYREWSDGQKALFHLVLSLAFGRPDIILFDEIENHLHPAFISQMLEILRTADCQVIATTHHPHVIFARLVDRVFYMETERATRHASPPETFPYSKRYSDGTYPRRIATLEDSFSKISATYKLFDQQDDLLLRQAAYVATASTLKLFEAIERAFSNEAVKASGRPLPDAQTTQLADRIRDFVEPASVVRVFDLGAGVGREVAELSKLSRWQLGTTVSWTCWDPDVAKREALRQRFAGDDQVRVIDDIAAPPESSFDLCVIANVLHELTPSQFADAITEADRLVDHKRGGIVILELFPLLHAERFAVPYPAEAMTEMLREARFLTSHTLVPTRHANVSAYCAFARCGSYEQRVDRKQLMGIVENAWQRLESAALSDYASLRRPRTLDTHQHFLQSLTTVASIEAWRKGFR